MLPFGKISSDIYSSELVKTLMNSPTRDYPFNWNVYVFLYLYYHRHFPKFSEIENYPHRLPCGAPIIQVQIREIQQVTGIKGNRFKRVMNELVAKSDLSDLKVTFESSKVTLESPRNRPLSQWRAPLLQLEKMIVTITIPKILKSLNYTKRKSRSDVRHDRVDIRYAENPQFIASREDLSGELSRATPLNQESLAIASRSWNPVDSFSCDISSSSSGGANGLVYNREYCEGRELADDAYAHEWLFDTQSIDQVVGLQIEEPAVLETKTGGIQVDKATVLDAKAIGIAVDNPIVIEAKIDEISSEKRTVLEARENLSDRKESIKKEKNNPLKKGNWVSAQRCRRQSECAEGGGGQGGGDSAPPPKDQGSQQDLVSKDQGIIQKSVSKTEGGNGGDGRDVLPPPPPP